MTEKKKAKAVYYELTPYGRKEGEVHKGESYTIKGNIGDHVIVSISEGMSNISAQELGDKLKEELGKPIIMITHNISFLKAVKVKASEAVDKLENKTDE